MLKPYYITDMIIDDKFDGEETVTVDFTLNNDVHSITFKKSDLEILNSWIFKNGTSLPANLSENILESLREEVKNKI
ncbi:hypothetical protein [uncultured Metabacillus sp.]|uniref:hypothetical protein n=1 Tax=Metabacillus sp. Hm71 TaxID=3450743 RepID=UPI00262DB046|nr:hypothetical protein [uncultured Metabacillus sp.]